MGYLSVLRLLSKTQKKSLMSEVLRKCVIKKYLCSMGMGIEQRL